MNVKRPYCLLYPPLVLMICMLTLLAVNFVACSTTKSGTLNTRRPIDQVVEELRREARSGIHTDWSKIKEILPMRRGQEEYIVFRVEGMNNSGNNVFPGFRSGYRIEIEYLGTPFKLNNR